MEYVEKFHNLGGETIGEHYKNFNQYLNHLSSLNATEIETILQNIKPKNLQEAIFHIELLTKYEQYEALKEILLTSNKHLNKKLTRNLKLIKYIISNYPPEEFINKLCPKISHVTRINIINKLSSVLTDSNLAEEYFNGIFDKYGIKLAASALLVSCSETFVNNNVSEHTLKISDKQLIKLHKKYPKFAEYYFSDTPFNFNKRTKFAHYLAINDVATFSKLSEKEAPYIGRKGLYNFMQINKQEFIENPDKYKNILKARIAKKVFNADEYQEFFKNLFPSIDEFSIYSLKDYIIAIPPKFRGNAIFEAYEKNYNCKYSQDDFSTELLDLLLIEDRVKFALEEKFPEYLPIDKSIDLIKEKIKLTSDITLRSELLNKLIKTCKVNNNEKALLEVLEYFVKRHKNEISTVRQSFIAHLSEDFKLGTLSEDHWKHVQTLIKIAEVNGEEHWSSNSIYEQLIEFNYIRGLDYIEELTKYVTGNGIYGWSLLQDKPEISRNCIIQLGKILDTIKLRQASNADLANSFFYTVMSYNKKNLKTKISYLQYPEYVNRIFKLLERQGTYTYFIEEMMTSKAQNLEEEELLNDAYEKYFIVKSEESCDKILMFFLKHKPELLKNHAESCFDTESFKLKPAFYYEASKMHCNNISQKFKEIALRIVNNELSKASQMEPALIFLAFGDGCLNMLNKYQPTNYTIDIFEDNMKEILAVRKAVLNSLRNTPVSVNNMSIILPYCKGDYLQHARGALYKTLYNIPQELIEKPINSLLENKESMEQGVDLVSNLYTSQRIKNIFTKLGATEQRKSIGKFIFKRCFKFLSHFPDDDFYNLFIKNFQLIDSNDSESFELLMGVNNIPTKYRPQYIKTVWDYAKQLKKHLQVVSMLKLEIWKKVPQELCQEILNAVLFNEKNEHKDEIENLLYEHLLNGGDLLIIYKKTVEPKAMYQLLVNICTKLIKDNKRKKQALELSKKLTATISDVPLQYHKYHIEFIFESTYHFLQIENNFLDSLIEFVLKKQAEAIDKFGLDIQIVFVNIATIFIKDAITSMQISNLKNREKIITDLLLQAAEKIAKTSDSSHVKLLALHLIPKQQTKNKEFIRKKKEVVEAVLANSNEVVKVFVADVYYKEDI